MTAAQNIRGPRKCAECPNKFTPNPQGKIPQRCPQCRNKNQRGPRKCQDCPTVFTPGLRGAHRLRCDQCRDRMSKVWARETYRRSAIAVPIDNTRPCPTCNGPIPRSGKVYAKYCSDPCKPRCSVDECDGPVRKRDWCAGHYSMWQRKGEVKPFSYKWGDKGGECLACGTELDGATGYRDFCNSACHLYYKAHGPDAPKVTHCIHCLIEIPIGKVEGRQRRQRFDIKQCRRCKQDLVKHGMSAEQLAVRDGATCRLCFTAVNMTLRAPDPGCPSVDHRIPRSKGGTNDPDNLQLAHLRCNILKHDKLIEESVLAA